MKKKLILILSLVLLLGSMLALTGCDLFAKPQPREGGDTVAAAKEETLNLSL